MVLTSDKLLHSFKDLLKEFDIKKWCKYSGSFMSIKIAYIFLKTICQIKNIDFLAIDGFTF